jgi:hypothetical protein
LLENMGNSLFSVEPALLRAVHFAFTQPPRPTQVIPKNVLNLARAFKEIEPGA